MERVLNMCCRVLPVYTFFAAVIANSGLKIRNRCADCPCFDLLAASIRKSGLEIENRCTDYSCFDLMAASIRKSGLEIENRCSAIVPASRTARLQRSRGVQAGTGCHEGGILLSKKPPEWHLATPQQRYRVRFFFSLPQSITACLQRSRGAQAGTGCHEGGIILSKKPPEWHLVTPQQRYRVRFKFSLPQSRTARLRQLLPPGYCN